MKKYKPYLIGVAAVEAVGTLAGLLSREGSKRFEQFAAKPPLSPPGWIFPVVWTALYALMGVGVTRVFLAQERKSTSAVNWFIIQLTLNFFWTLVFFNLEAYGLASAWIVALWIAELITLLKFYKVDPLAGLLQIPYQLWLTFASYLTFGVWLYNS